MNPDNLDSDLHGKNPPGNPIYPSKEDIYSHEEKEPFDEEVTPDTNKKENEISLDEGLDVPGAELDDADEIIGEEDEENNYYSLGGDKHDDPGE
ncbi:MAG: hypothetical protein ABI288_04980 [Ginsengibacter sp.]